MQNGFPLRETRCGNGQRRILLQVHLPPDTPVAVRIVHVPASRKQFHIPATTKLYTSPLRKDVRIEHVALVTALGIGSFAQNENLPQVAGRGIERATRRLSE